MKREFDLNNLTDDEVELMGNSLEMRRITKMCIPDAHSLITQAMSAGIRHHEITAIVTPNYGNADRGVFAGFRQSGKSGTMSELFKPYLEFKYDDAISAEHEQYFAVFNQIRGSRLELV